MLPSVFVLDTILSPTLEGQTLFWHIPTIPQHCEGKLFNIYEIEFKIADEHSVQSKNSSEIFKISDLFLNPILAFKSRPGQDI